jgi:hypothetical protein
MGRFRGRRVWNHTAARVAPSILFFHVAAYSCLIDSCLTPRIYHRYMR